MSYGGYPPPGGQGSGYPPQHAAYPPSQPGYPPVQGGYGASPSGYPPQPQGGGYPPASGYGAPPALGFEGVAAQSSGPPQPPAQNYSYGMPPPVGGYGGYPPAGMPPAQPSYQPQGQYPPQQPYGQGYPAAAPAQQGYTAQAPVQGYPSAPATSQQHLYGPAQTQPQYGQLPVHQGYASSHSPKPGKRMTDVTGAMASMKIATHGTVKPASGFNAEADSQTLRKAMKGMGTDEKAIINIIGYRSNGQRQELKTSYKQSFGRDLVKDLKSELGGNFEELALALMMKPREFDAYCLKKAMAGAGTTESTLIEIMSSRSNAEIKEIRELYKKHYGKELEKALISETSGYFGKFLVSLNNAARDESNYVDVGKARQDAEALYKAGEKKLGTDEATFNRIMASRSFPQLRATFDEYHKIANRDIIKSLQGEFSGDIEDAMCSIVDIARDTPAYFAKRLYRSMKGIGTDDSALIRVVVSRSEVDMVEVKERFHSMFKQPLSKFISDDTSGDYKKLLLAIVGS